MSSAPVPGDGTAPVDTDALRKQVLAAGNLPAHVAIIMDGNGRWAARRRLPRVAGHRAGRHAVRRTLRACIDLGVEVLTLYTFSQENWKRPALEVKALWAFLREVLASERRDLARQNIRLAVTGDLASIPAEAKRVLDDAVAALAANTGLVLNLALAYGGRQEIVHAARALARRAAAGELDPDAIDEDLFRAHLYQPDLPDPDLVIRTSGEYRLSNFLTWQTAYAEMYFTPVLWPDFCERDLLLAVADYQRRERRFGGTGEQSADPTGGDAPVPLDPARWRAPGGSRS